MVWHAVTKEGGLTKREVIIARAASSSSGNDNRQLAIGNHKKVHGHIDSLISAQDQKYDFCPERTTHGSAVRRVPTMTQQVTEHTPCNPEDKYQTQKDNDC
jgi:hypothetical protein